MTRLVKASSALPTHIARDRVVSRLLEAEKALAQAVGVDQVKLVMDVAAAQEVFAKRQKLGEDVIGYAHTVKIRALARLGELLKPLEKAKGGAEVGVGRRGKNAVTDVNSIPRLADLGVDRRTSMIAQQLADLPSDIRESIAQREKTLSEVRRERKAIEVRRLVTLPDAKYRVLYADPPWAYNDKADAGSVQAGGVAVHYPTESIQALCTLADRNGKHVQDVIAKDAVLFLWVTSPLLFESAAVFKAWGFTYKASFVWDKVKHNMGHYNSVRHEFLLICTKGSCTPDAAELFDSVQSIEKTTHSTKPAAFRQIIDTLYPYGKRLELFARERVEGWDSFGYEVASAPEVIGA